MSASRTTTQSRNAWSASIFLVLGLWLFSWFLSSTPPFRIIELKVLDLLYEFRGPVDISESPVVLVAISETAAEELAEKWPWPTHYYARLVHNLNRAGARVIGIDVIFDKNDIYNPANDTVFGEALREYGNVILAGNVMTDVRRAFDVEDRMRVETRQLVQPNRVLRDYNPNAWGYVEVERDRDGFLRRYSMQKRHLDEMYHPLGIKMLMNYLNISEEAIREDHSNFYFGNNVIPKVTSSTFMINYAGPESSFPEFDFSDVIDDEDFLTASEDEDFQINAFDDPDFGLLQAGVFRDKLVLVGATMPELQDFYSTPYAPFGSMPGYETHANAIQTILSGLYINRVSNNWILLISLILSLVIGLSTIFSGPVKSLAGSVISVLVILFSIWWLFTERLWLLEATHLLLAVVLPYSGAAAYGYIKEQRQKVRIQSMFGTYVSPELVNRMVESGDEPKLGGDESEITAFFSDIAGFSTFSENMTASRLVDLMNDYLTAMTDILTGNEGTLDKYIGDAIVAFWGAPIITSDHAFKACKAARLMLNEQRALRAKWKKDGSWPEVVYQMQTRIGLNTGVAITGNMGSAKRFNYTMMGDTVNLAARCESGAKAYGVYCMTTEQTKIAAESYGDDCVFRKLDRIIVKGRSKPVTVYEVVDLRSAIKPEYLECIDLFEKGLGAYFEQDWKTAGSFFQRASLLEPGYLESSGVSEYTPSHLFMNRCIQMTERPPDAGWDGVYVMKTK